MSLALYIDADVLERLERRDPFAALTHENLADYLTAAEGVSHFVYVAWNAGHDKPVTLLELELQAEIDKYVLGAWLLRAQCGRFPRELHRVLFERARVDPAAAAGRVGLYRTASAYAARFCRQVASRLERTRQRHGARAPHGVAPVLSPGKRAQDGAHRTLRLSDSRRGSRYSTSLSSCCLRASSSRFSLIHSPSLRRSRLTGGFFASGTWAAPTR